MVHSHFSEADGRIAAMIDPGDPQLAEFWAGAADGVLRVQWCASCCAHQWPPRPVCRTCFGPVSWVEADTTGNVYSWVVVHLSPLPAFEQRVPYTVVIGELPGASDIRVVARWDSDASELSIGAPIALAFQEIAERTSVPVWRV
jgi:uncharacterized OB-fold protein